LFFLTSRSYLRKRDELPVGTFLHRSNEMGHGLSSVVAWQTVVPVVMGTITIFMAKWFSHLWAQTAVERTVRVVSRLGSRDAGRRSRR
jgi:hypothetical protein